MSQYLLNIAARSNGNSSNDLMPVRYDFNAKEQGLGNDFGKEHHSQYGEVQNQFSPQDTVPVIPTPLQKVQPPDVVNSSNHEEKMRSDKASYFSKHIERVEADVERNPVKKKNAGTLTFEMNEPLRKDVFQNVESINHINEQGFVNKTVSKIEPKKKGKEKTSGEKVLDNDKDVVREDKNLSFKKPVITPLMENAVEEKNKVMPRNKVFERITPMQPEINATKQQQRNNTNQTANKLVIGKIIVEMLPPKQPLPQKVITRVVQSSSKDIFPKSNKLSFGLGQL